MCCRRMSDCPMYQLEDKTSLKLEVTKTCIIACMSSNFGQTEPLAMELAAIERLKCTHFNRLLLV